MISLTHKTNINLENKQKRAKGRSIFDIFIFQKNRRNSYGIHILKNIKEIRVHVWQEKRKPHNQQKKERKESSKISRFWMRLFDKCFILKSPMKSIEILLEK